MSKLGKAFKVVKDYFSLQPRPEDNGDYAFAVEARPLKAASVGEGIRNYFDLNSGYRAALNLSVEIMQLANTHGVAKGRFEPAGMTGSAGFSFREGGFEINLKGSGRILLKCDADFAEKVAKLPAAASVAPLAPPKPVAAAPKP